jgi:WXG100 family type VII secretion target
VSYTVSKVRNSKPDVLNTAATDAETSAQRVDAQIAQGRRHMDELREGWTGTASDAAGKQYGELITKQRAYSEQLRALKTVLDARAPNLVDFRSKLDTAVNDAEHQWDVADDGSVSPGFWLKWYLATNPTQIFTFEARRIEIENHIKLLLAQFEAEDLAAGHEIRQIGRELT